MEEQKKRRRPPATTPEAQENKMISLAMSLAERQLSDGTASSQVITHFLKLGSSREQLEQQKIQQENGLTKAKSDEIKSRKSTEESYKKALDAMRRYSGRRDEDD